MAANTHFETERGNSTKESSLSASNCPTTFGVRYNAEKKKIGNYYSTAILSFRMKCHLCDNWFEIHTNPKNATYDIAGGARKKIEDFTAEDNETIEIDTPEEFERRANDKFARLEHVEQDAIKAKSGATVLTRLQRLNDRQWSDPYALSQKLRKEFRADKKAKAKEVAECKAVADRVGFAFSILPESESDRMGSKRIEFEDADKAKMERKLMDIKTGGLFSGVRGSRTGNGRSSGALVKSRSTIHSKDLSGSTVAQNLASTVRANTRLQLDPFLAGSTAKSSLVASQKLSLSASRQAPPAKAPLVDYGNDDSESD
ncbi:hypothetical protein BGZ82_005137 [Podila clonocystis]|nr:hypothetical protein BGZ82_005137 [Podila clonocystis]